MATAQQIITKFRVMVGGYGLDSDYELQLVNDAIYEIEGMKDWEMMKKETTFSITAGSDYSTTYSLPTGFCNDLRMVENNDLEYVKYSFEDRYAKVNSSNAYFIDLATGKLGFCGSSLPARTMYFYYTGHSAELAVGSTWNFPARFHNIIPYQMAELFFASDMGERGRSWDDKWQDRFNKILDEMTLWDDRLKTKNRVSRQYLNRENSLNLLN